MRKAFTLSELIVIIAIITVIATIMVNSLTNKIQPGHDARWNGKTVRVISKNVRTHPTTYLIRLENNKELTVTYDELTPIVVKAERE